MIENDEQLDAAVSALGDACFSLATLQRAARRPVSSSKPLMREISRLRADIAAYLGLDLAEPLQEAPPFVIENEEQLRGTHVALGHLYAALAALRNDLSSTDPNYPLYAEG